jgi:tyrosine-protein kinase Etk/Wzc
VVPAGPIPPNPAELLQSEKMEEFIEEAKKHYDYIIYDTPPVAVVSDALIVNRFSDMTIFVIRQNYSSKQVLNLINDLYDRKDFKNLALLMNDVSSPGYYGSRYSYGYYEHGYGYSYQQGYYDEDEKPGNWRDKIKGLLKKG